MDAAKEWIFRTSIYEVNIRQYTREGTIQAFLPHLQRLKAMGVQAVWFMPLTPISNKEKKGTLGSYYACSDYTSISREFGNEQDFRNLVSAAHQLGMKVVIDWVANHTGWDHVWTKKHPEWFEQDSEGNFVRASGMDDIIELNFNSAEMRKAMLEAMRYWITEFDIDGFRCDLAFWVPLDFWQEAIPEMNRIKSLFWLAEMDPIQHPRYMEVFDAAYAWKWMHLTEEWYHKKLSPAVLKQVLTEYENTRGLKTWFTSNHDENSWNGTEYEKYGEAALMLAVFSCTWPGIPLIYSGQEIPNRRRLHFFDKDELEWNGYPQLEAFYSTLLHLKSQHAAMDARADLYIIPASHSNVFAFLRKQGDDEVLILLNFAEHSRKFLLYADWIEGEFEELFSKEIFHLHKSREYGLSAWGYKIFVKSAG